MPVTFKVLPTGNQELEQIQQNITDVVNALQSASAQTGQGVAHVTSDYTLQPSDKYVLSSASGDTKLILGAPNVTTVCVVVNAGTGAMSIGTADNKTDLGSISAGQQATVSCNAKSWSRT